MRILRLLTTICALALATGSAQAGTTIKLCLTDSPAKGNKTIGILDSRAVDVVIGLLDSRAVDTFIGVIDSEAGADIVIEKERDLAKADLALHITTSRTADKTISIRDSRAVDKTVCIRNNTRAADIVVCVKDPLLRINKQALVAIFETLGILKQD